MSSFWLICFLLFCGLRAYLWIQNFFRKTVYTKSIDNSHIFRLSLNQILIFINSSRQLVYTINSRTNSLANFEKSYEKSFVKTENKHMFMFWNEFAYFPKKTSFPLGVLLEPYSILRFIDALARIDKDSCYKVSFFSFMFFQYFRNLLNKNNHVLPWILVFESILIIASIVYMLLTKMYYFHKDMLSELRNITSSFWSWVLFFKRKSDIF